VRAERLWCKAKPRNLEEMGWASKKFGRDGMGFAVVERGKARDKKLKIREVVVFDTEVIHHQNKRNRARDVTEKARRSGFKETVRSKVRDKAILGELARLL
jgi:hypothetical protein